MDGFLKKVSEFIFSTYGEKIDDLCIVLPNRRAGLFLKNHFSEHSKIPIWSPAIFSIEDFIWELSGLKKADTAEQLFIFYSVYKEAEKEKAEPFELFCKWAPTLLNDFNETDSYLADTEKLFGNLSDIKGIEEWSLGDSSLTDFQKKYLHFWSSIGKWYSSYRAKLLDEKIAYPGLAYRMVAENITSLIENKKWRKIIFAGFNALNTSEEKIFSALRESGKADLLWDTDRYYLENTANEAGKFLRKYKKEYFKPITGNTFTFEHIEDRFATEKKNITVIGVARMVSQAKAAAHFLKTLPEEKRYATSTAIVLADEQLLLPLLHALPEEASTINITMGFPLKNTPAATLVNALFSLHINAERFNILTSKQDAKRELKYYHADLTRLLRHPYIKQLLASSGLAEKLDAHLAKRNIIFSSSGQLQNVFPESKEAFQPIAQILIPWTNTTQALDGISAVIDLLRPIFANKNSSGDSASLNIDMEYLFQINLIVKRARTLLEKWSAINPTENIVGDIRSLKVLVDQQLTSSTLPFFGEPLSGLQIMGVLETRTLDFENVILLSANENIIPGGKVQHTFILFDLRKYFGMPVWDDKDAVSAYHFYRLLQRAKNIFIVHNTDTDQFGNREKSRFVTQLLYELPEANKNITIKEVVFDAGLSDATIAPEIISVPKTGSVPEKIKELGVKGLSPSLLNSFRSCGLKFYFHYIAHLREPDEVEETIGADTLGTIIHKALEELYKPAIGQLLSATFFDAALKKVEHISEAMFANYFSAEESSYGKNLLAKKIAIRYLKKYLELEKKKLSDSSIEIPHVAALETNLEFSFELDGKTILLKGQADRIDKTDSLITLIDYKTGVAEEKEVTINNWEEILNNPKIEKGFQLLMYAWLYSRMNGNNLPTLSGIVSFRKLSSGFLNVKTPEGKIIGDETLINFENALKQLLEELFDLEKEFVQTVDTNSCVNCDFKGICRR